MPKVDINEIVDNLDMATYNEICDNITKIDRTNMDVELSRHASHYSYYSAMQDLCKKRLDDKNLDLTMYMARTRKEKTEEGRTLTKKPTAKDLDDYVLSQQEYGAICREVNELTLKYNMLRSLVQSLGQKKDLLVQLSANMRAEKNIYS
tara:strand:+ start:1990 stop:2436 length:447 start_codon:yes stop_codon:yes gene_type:complete